MARFPAAARLRRSRDYERVFATGKRRHDRYFVVIAVRNCGVMPRLGLAISRRRARRAVDRNRIKRIVRESFRQHAATLPGLDIVILARRDTAATDHHALFASLSGHWRVLQRQPGSRGHHG